MALPKKGLRKITVSNCRYAWCAIGNDGWIGLFIAQLDNPGQLLETGFDYYSEVTGVSYTSRGQSITHTKQRLVITPYIVRQVIEYALKNGWNPQEKGSPLRLLVEDKISLRLVSRV